MWQLEKRPVTPPPNLKALDLANALKRLSVSPKKPQAKKRKVKATKPIIAPIFQISKPKKSDVNLKNSQDKKRVRIFSSFRKVILLT